MAETKWTAEQQQVISLRNRNILVAAAAGSGKTAVLVERILTMITDTEHPVDIDRLLIVTFTKAAAAEMRERIAAALLERQVREPENLLLRKQSTLLHHASISTIDSFCKTVILEHFQEIDLDPGFRVADEAEILLMKSDVMESLLEEEYEKAEESFLDFVECYASGRTDTSLEEVILQLARFADSNPDPEGWLSGRMKDFEGAPEESEWMRRLLSYLHAEAESLEGIRRAAVECCLDAGGPFHYEEALKSDGLLLRALTDAQTYEEFGVCLREVHFEALSRKRPKDLDEGKKEQVKALREQIKKGITELREGYFFQDKETLFRDISLASGSLSVMLGLAAEFLKRFAAAKRKKNIVDFSDLEHMALSVLRDTQGNPTEAAKEYQAYFEEILIDEYQDSNLIQELILTGISREAAGRPNVFMVGDVKQSIYKFRLARPEMFMEKYSAYTKEDGLYQKIDLHRNFRSRNEVLNAANLIFGAVMGRRLGGVEYDEAAMLYPGADFPQSLLADGEEAVCTPAEGTDFKCEVLLLEREEEAEAEDEGNSTGEDKVSLGQKELEAQLAAARIRELTGKGGQLVSERSAEGKMVLRPAEYRDIVILLRTMSGWADVFVRELAAAGIPAAAESGTGYFSAWEVRLVLDYLRILDNPRQDIPLAAVLFSPMAGLNTEEMALLRTVKKRVDLWEALLAVSQENESRGMAAKASIFLRQYQSFRKRIPYTPVHKLLHEILEETGIYYYAAAMEGGSKRAANLDMLLQKAADFEKTSYHGLFHFIRYIEKLQKYNIDFGEAAVMNGKENVVRIYSVHKSKGLEFPIVFVSGLAKKFNVQDSRSRLVIHPELGIGADYIDPVLRYQTPTLMKKVIAKQLQIDSLGEELRVLYVALTRAREKLILTGAFKKLEEKLVKWNRTPKEASARLPYHTLLKAGCALDLIMPAVSGQEAAVRVRQVTLPMLAGGEVVRQVKKQLELEELFYPEEHYSEPEQQAGTQIVQELSYEYPYRGSQFIKGKLTVSELKRLYLEEEEAGQTEFQETDYEAGFAEMEHVIPDFMKEETVIAGSTRGTLYHSILERLDLGKTREEDGLRAVLEELKAEQVINEEECRQINIRQLLAFTGSKLCERMRRAQAAGQLHRERPFVLGIPAGELYPEAAQAGAEELVLVQGIIDVYFEEQGELVLADYKTDRLTEGGEQELADRYQAQLAYYKRALEQLTGKRVKECCIYSLSLGKTIPVTV